ncbi:endolytic transglycosylase MltG [Nocardioides sp.]|uniref:endolytic transglycosylase MltG n=1 Tax=Nocardioides sp. TaxID=35761 RepID=UPI0035282142
MTDYDPRREGYLDAPGVDPSMEPTYADPQHDDPGHDEEVYDDDPYVAGGARRRSRPLSGCLAALVALAVLVAGGVLLVTMGKGFISDRFGGAQDYPGPGSGEVSFEVATGDTTTVIGRNLKSAGVVASVDAFLNAAAEEPKSSKIQVGTYTLKKEMAAADALAVLIDPANVIKNTVTIPEGLRVEDIVDTLAKKTDFSRADYEKVLAEPEKLGLPSYANDNPEGYLFPATYELTPESTPKSILKAMVKRFKQAAKDTDLEQRAADLGYEPGEIVTIASLVQVESPPKYMPKVARVIYNRLENRGETNYLLQLDATVNYAHGENLGATTTDEERNIDSPYNTYRVPGLPPGPISAPGTDALEAALEPADGPWFYYVTVNLRTGKTLFAVTLDEHNRNRAKLLKYCETSDAC